MTKLVKVCTLVHILRYSRIARAQTYDRVVPYTSHTVRGSGLYDGLYPELCILA